MNFAIDILILNKGAVKPWKQTVYFSCKAEEIQERVKTWFQHKDPQQVNTLKGVEVISRTAGPAEYFPGTVFPTYKQYSICWL